MQRANGILVFLMLAAVILLGFIAGKVAEPPQALPTYTPWPTYTPMPTYTPYPTAAPILKLQPLNKDPLNAIGKNYPYVDGSTSTKPLQDLIICRVYELNCYWRFTHLGDEREIQALSQGEVVSGTFTFPVTSFHSGTHEAYMNLIFHKTDFILVARPPSADEMAAAKAAALDVRPVALDAFVMLDHADNPVDTISLDQIRGIYSGKITNWSEIGGLDSSIHAYQREENSGSQELLKSLIMEDIPIINAPNMIVYTMRGPFNAIQGLEDPNFGALSDPDGIGYSVYYYTWFIMGPLQDVRIMAVDGVRPTSKTIANHTYPLIAPVYVVIRGGEPADSTAVLLRDWLLTADGQRVVEQSGYVPITPPQ